MWTLVVAPLNLVTNDQLRLIKCLERVLPDTLFLEISKEPFNDPILLRCVGCNELLLQPIVTTGLPKGSGRSARCRSAALGSTSVVASRIDEDTRLRVPVQPSLPDCATQTHSR
jgi:hypothetical protein